METKIDKISKKLDADDDILLRIYIQVKENGYVSSEDMRRVVGIGIPCFTILSEILKVQKSEAHSMCSDGKVTFEDFEKMIDFYHKNI